MKGEGEHITIWWDGEESVNTGRVRLAVKEKVGFDGV